MPAHNENDDFYGRNMDERIEAVVLNPKGILVSSLIKNENKFTKKFIRRNPVKASSKSTIDSGVSSENSFNNIYNYKINQNFNEDEMYSYAQTPSSSSESMNFEDYFAAELAKPWKWLKPLSPVIEMIRTQYDATNHRPSQEIKDLPRTDSGNIMIEIGTFDKGPSEEYHKRMNRELGLSSQVRFKRAFRRVTELPDASIYAYDVVNEGNLIDYDEEPFIKGGGGEQIQTYKVVKDLQLDGNVLANCNKMKFNKLRPIQQWLMPIILNSSNDCIVSAPAGYGKTFAYLLPLLKKICDDMNDHMLIGNKRRNPKVLVFVSSHTLAFQTCERVLKLVGVGADKPIITYVSGGGPKDKQIHSLANNGCDMLFATTGRFGDLKKSKHILLNEVHTIVLDDADKVMNRWTIEELQEVKVRASQNVRVLCFSTTYDEEVLQKIDKCLKATRWRIQMGNLNSVNRLVKQEFYDIRNGNSLKELFKQIAKRNETVQYRHHQMLVAPKTIVFVNKGEDSVLLADFLNLQSHLCNYTWKALPYYNGMPAEALNRTIKTFNSADGDGSANILVTCDMLVGYDAYDVKLVINYGLPVRHTSYIQRIGRTGRNGHFGCAVTIVTERIVNLAVFQSIIATAQESDAVLPSSLINIL